MFQATLSENQVNLAANVLAHVGRALKATMTDDDDEAADSIATLQRLGVKIELSGLRDEPPAAGTVIMKG